MTLGKYNVFLLYDDGLAVCVRGGRRIQPALEARATTVSRVVGTNPRAAARPLHVVLALSLGILTTVQKIWFHKRSLG